MTDVTDLIKRLGGIWDVTPADLADIKAAASALEAQQAEIERLREAYTTEVEALRNTLLADVVRLREALVRIERHARVNFGHQNEKLADIAPMARSALNHKTEG